MARGSVTGEDGGGVAVEGGGGGPRGVGEDEEIHRLALTFFRACTKLSGNAEDILPQEDSEELSMSVFATFARLFPEVVGEYGSGGPNKRMRLHFNQVGYSIYGKEQSRRVPAVRAKPGNPGYGFRQARWRDTLQDEGDRRHCEKTLQEAGCDAVKIRSVMEAVQALRQQWDAIRRPSRPAGPGRPRRSQNVDPDSTSPPSSNSKKENVGRSKGAVSRTAEPGVSDSSSKGNWHPSAASKPVRLGAPAGTGANSGKRGRREEEADASPRDGPELTTPVLKAQRTTLTPTGPKLASPEVETPDGVPPPMVLPAPASRGAVTEKVFAAEGTDRSMDNLELFASVASAVRERELSKTPERGDGVDGGRNVAPASPPAPGVSKEAESAAVGGAL